MILQKGKPIEETFRTDDKFSDPGGRLDSSAANKRPVMKAPCQPLSQCL